MTLAKRAAEEEPQGERRRLRVPTSVAGEEEKPPGERRRLRVPTSVAATLLVAMLSILVGPAFARQWDDRQKARDLKAAIAD